MCWRLPRLAVGPSVISDWSCISDCAAPQYKKTDYGGNEMYKYIAKAKDGQVVKGELDAPSRDRAAAMVSAIGLYLVSVSEGTLAQ